MKSNFYNYIICGGGASGLIIANAILEDGFFSDKSILIIEKDLKNTNDKTWSFWEEKNGKFDDIVYKSWSKTKFESSSLNETFNISPLIYKTIRSKKFYEKFYEKFKSNDQVDIIRSKVKAINPKVNETIVTTDTLEYSAEYVFSSILDPTLIIKSKYPCLKQHFVGWIIKTEKPFFNEEEVVLMDFNISQDSKTRFMYVLPFNKKEALVEFTLFSRSLLKKEEYEDNIKRYLEKKEVSYEITKTENGVIPMTSYPFEKNNKSRLLYIGTAGGWTKSSSGYTFKNIINKSEALIQFLKKGKPLNDFKVKSRYKFYDLLFLDVLFNYNHLGSEIFTSMFKNNSILKILSFLEEKTTFCEDLKIMYSFPLNFKFLFIKAFFRNIFRFLVP
jgi:lycopene beta-cyclase